MVKKRKDNEILASGVPTVWFSKDFEHWYNYTIEVPSLKSVNLRNFWAPDIIEGIDGKYYLYFGLFHEELGDSTSLSHTFYGKGLKGPVSSTLYLSGALIGFMVPWVAALIYLLAAFFWRLPDKKVEHLRQEP